MTVDLPLWPEHARLKALFSYGIIDTPNEIEFDLLAEEMKSHFGTFCAGISFIDNQNQYFKALAGADVKVVPLGSAFCRYTIRQADAFVIPNALKDPRFALSPFVAGPFAARSFIGQTIFSSNGMPIGTVCVCDNKVREFTAADLQALNGYVQRVQALLELRLQKHQNSEQTSLLAA